MAIGRSPVTSGMGLESTGVKFDKKGRVLVDVKQVRILFCCVLVLIPPQIKFGKKGRVLVDDKQVRIWVCFVSILIPPQIEFDKKGRVLVDDKQVRIWLCVVFILHCLTHMHRVTTYIAGSLDRAGTQSPLISLRTRRGVYLAAARAQFWGNLGLPHTSLGPLRL
jgi:hypothetical protein